MVQIHQKQYTFQSNKLRILGQKVIIKTILNLIRNKKREIRTRINHEILQKIEKICSSQRLNTLASL